MFTYDHGSVPDIPQVRNVKLNMVQSPYYANNVDHQALDGPDAVYQANRESLAEVYTLSHSNSTQSAVGIILSADGYILTNAHLVEAAKRIVVYLPDGRLLPAALVGSDNMTDMAVLYVQAQGLTPATFGTSKTLQVADPIYTVSLQENAQLPMVMQQGSMFTASRKFSTKHYHLNLLQTCHHSESGPLFNSFGHVVGLCVSRTAQYFDEMDNLGVVLGSNSMESIIDQLVQNGYVVGRPDLGFQVEAVSKLFQHYWDLPGGLMVSGLAEDSEPASRGLRNGDIILALNGDPLKNRDDLYAVLYSCSIGEEVIAVIFRDGGKKTVTLTVSELGA
jgi:serine protease Do